MERSPGPDHRPNAVFAPGARGQLGSAEMERLSSLGKRPRKDYVEVARALDAEVIDTPHLVERGTTAARWLERRIGGLPAALYEGYVSRNRYGHVLVWADRVGLPLAFLYKVTGSRRDVTLYSVYLTQGRKAFFLQRLRAHSHLGAIVNTTPLQLEIAHTKLGVPRHKLHHLHQPVDDLFWHPLDGVDPNPMICSVGWEARDFATLVSAVGGLAVKVRLAVGVAALASASNIHKRTEENKTINASPKSPSPFEGLKGTFTYDLYREWVDQIARDGLPPNVEVREQVDPEGLRDLYRRSRFVVVPLHDVEFDAGITAITEAMAMGKAVIVSQTRGQAGVISHGSEGFFVRPNDARPLRQAIEYLLDRPEEAERMGRAGRQLVEERHRLNDFVRQLTEIVRHASGH